ncbi:MAG: BrnT family toxin [Chloroflexi bacterium]|nr:BrnT family toxin [Chloroflexota bacterium]
MPPAYIEFEWSAPKAARNLKDHKVGFEEAQTAFDDNFAYIFDDEWHSDDEPREILIGYSNRKRLLFISFIQRAHDRIRIISARLADGKEHELYEEKSRF